MEQVDVRAMLAETCEFVAEATRRLEASLGRDDPLVERGHRALAALEALPEGGVVVTERSLAVAMLRVWPYRRATASSMTLSAAAILAALRTAR